jgi:hypothetical protein
LPRLFPENVTRTVDGASALVNISAMSKTVAIKFAGMRFVVPASAEFSVMLDAAAVLGSAAHAAGNKRVAGWDAALMALVNGCPSFSDERSALMAAWLRAYDACVCAALMSFDPNT